jgi:hypothetical protein
LDFSPCNAPFDEVDKVDMDPTNGLVSSVRDAKFTGNKCDCLSTGLQIVWDQIYVHNMTQVLPLAEVILVRAVDCIELFN